MVSGADVLCDMIDSLDIGYITVIVDTEPSENHFTAREYTLDFVNSTTSNGEQDGANYRMREFKLDVWLCNVTKYLFGEFPATFYIRLS